MEFIKDVLSYVAIAVGVLLLNAYVVSPVSVVGDSMNANLEDGDFLIVDKLSTNLGKISRFEVVIIELGAPKYIIKRVVGMPGEKLEYRANKLYINDQLIEELYLGINEITEDLVVEEIPEGHYFVIGDNRDVSIDSRSSVVGYVPKENIVGVARLTVWPYQHIGKVE